jgi:hypothetical protein
VTAGKERGFNQPGETVVRPWEVKHHRSWIYIAKMGFGLKRERVGGGSKVLERGESFLKV